MNKKDHYPEKIDTILDTFLQERGYLSICKEYDVIAQWKEIVGEKVSRVTQCEKVENGVLYVRVISSTWRNEIAYCKKFILDSIKKNTGCTSIKDIVIF
jgi:predicted nucleic acid-binding Zn ribbon protein